MGSQEPGRTWRNGTGTLVVHAPAQGPRTVALEEHAAVAAEGHAAVAAGRRATVAVEIAASYRTRARGLLGRDGIDGALLLTPCGSVHTFGMRFAIDVAYLDRELNVLAVRTMKPGRLGMPRLRARHVLESAAGAMREWGVEPGVRLVINA
ncbi:DUF192 domain-containing protein [Streptomyces sp. NPDC047928]|uniref:DUF192 domain-containing protein n=1 Tax=unclassified Streptomyces TaxID=2593676 RepID=UPI00371FB75C